MEKVELAANKREVLGKRVRFLRRQGITPVHLFGHSVDSLPLQCDTVELRHVLALAGQTRLISLKLDKGKKPKNVLVREVQREPVTGQLLHVDFYQVSMAEKIEVEVPIVIVGEAPALKLKENFMTHELNSMAIECLPDEIPDRVEVDVSSLTEAEQGIHVADIALGGGITILTNPEQLVVKINARVAEKLIEEEGAEAPEGVPLPEEGPKEESSSAS